MTRFAQKENNEEDTIGDGKIDYSVWHFTHPLLHKEPGSDTPYGTLA